MKNRIRLYDVQTSSGLVDARLVVGLGGRGEAGEGREGREG